MHRTHRVSNCQRLRSDLADCQHFSNTETKTVRTVLVSCSVAVGSARNLARVFEILHITHLGTCHVGKVGRQGFQSKHADPVSWVCIPGDNGMRIRRPATSCPAQCDSIETEFARAIHIQVLFQSQIVGRLWDPCQGIVGVVQLPSIVRAR